MGGTATKSSKAPMSQPGPKGRAIHADRLKDRLRVGGVQRRTSCKQGARVGRTTVVGQSAQERIRVLEITRAREIAIHAAFEVVTEGQELGRNGSGAVLGRAAREVLRDDRVDHGDVVIHEQTRARTRGRREVACDRRVRKRE